MAKQQPKSYFLSGRITSLQNESVAGLIVRAFDLDPTTPEDQLGEAVVTDSDGRYSISFTEKDFSGSAADKGPDVLIRVYKEQQLIAESEVRYNSNVKIEIDLSIDQVMDSSTESGTETFTVTGKVTNSNGESLANLKVVLVDIDLRVAAIYRTVVSLNDLIKMEVEVLGTVSTDNDGTYSLSFNATAFARQERDKPDVVAYVIEEETILGRSKISTKKAWNKSNELMDHDVILQQTLKRGIAEYTKIMGAIMPLMKEAQLQLHEIAASSDQIAFLAEESNQEWNHVILLSQAALRVNEFSKESISHELLYAMGRQQLSLMAVKWAFIKRSAIASAIQKSIDENIINAVDEKSIDTFMDKIIELSTSHITEGSDEAVTQIQQVLGFSTQDTQLQSAFIEAQRDYIGTEAKFWSEYLPGLAAFKDHDHVIHSLNLTHELSTLTQVNLPLIQEIQVNAKITDLKQLMTLDTSEWTAMIDKSGVPANMNVDKETYITQIQKKLDVTYPTHRISLMVDTNALGLATHIQGPLSSFLHSAQDFDISKSNIDKYDHLFENTTDKAAVKSELKTIQRLYQVSPSAEALAKLKSLNFTSAAQIAAMPASAFMKKYSVELGEENAKAVLEMSRTVSAKAQQIGVMIHKEVMVSKPEIMNTLDLMSTVENHIPNLAELFGTMSYCACDHCRSVYSPAAYLVDVLRFLEKSAENDDATSPYEILMARRPDLADLKLTCENTNTIIPYIDLVNEILEYYVANGRISAAAAYDTGNTNAAELRASPQNLIEEAYRRISSAVYPFTLPYHQPLDVIHTYLDHLKVDRFELMNLFRQNETERFAKEYFRFSDEEFTLITSNSLVDVHQKYGYQPIEDLSFSESLHRVPEFLKRTGIAYTDLIALLKTQFLNPGMRTFTSLEQTFKSSGIDSNSLYHILVSVVDGTYAPTDEFTTVLTNAGWANYSDFKSWLDPKFANFKSLVTLFQPDSACDIGTTVLRSIESIYTTSPDNLPIFYARFHRFVRLWRKLGWSINEVDQLINTTAHNEINADTIHNLATIAQIHKNTGIPLSRISSLWGEMDSLDHKSTYHKLFLSKSIQTLSIPILENVFAVQANGTVPKANENIYAHIPAILAAIGISENDFNLIQADLEWTDSEVMNVESLSDLYKYNLLSKALKMSISDFITIKNWSHLNPFDPTHIDSTLGFINVTKQIKSSGFKINTLSYLFGTQLDNNEYGITVEESEILAKSILLKLPKVDTSTAETIAATQQKVIEELAAQIASSLKLTPEIIQVLIPDLLELILNPDELSETDYSLLLVAEIAVRLSALQKPAILLNTFKLQADELAYILAHISSFGNVNFEQPDFPAWKRIAEYVAFRNLKGVGKAAILPILEASVDATIDLDGLIVLMAGLLKWNKSDIEALQLHFGHTSKNSYLNELALYKYYLIFQTATASTISVAKLKEIANPIPNFDGLIPLANDIKLLTKSKYNEAAWPSISAKLNDIIRENQKQALISYVMTLIPVSSPDKLYEYFLIDVQMDACMDTSRIKQAISSIQLFIQRCLLNLEAKYGSDTTQIGVAPDQIDTDRWSWMKNYRVWEANRKIFLYPENWLEPEWRDDKTPFFKELESELLQGDITDANVETAFRNYLRKLDAVSNLDIVGMHQENMGEQYRLHVVGRTHSLPYQHYYRTYTSMSDRWEAWTKIPVDIKGVEDGMNSGVHLLPIIWKGRLFLFWPEFFQKVEQRPSSAITIPRNTDGSTTVPANEPVRYWEIKLAWTELKEGKWTPKTISKEFLRPGINDDTPTLFESRLNNYQLHPEIDNSSNELRILLFHTSPHSIQGSFILKDINESIRISYLRSLSDFGKSLPFEIYRLNHSKFHFSGIKADSQFQKRLNGELRTFLRSSNIYVSIFDAYESVKHITSIANWEANPHGFFGKNTLPFFYTANNKSYFVKPSGINPIVRTIFEAALVADESVLVDYYSESIQSIRIQRPEANSLTPVRQASSQTAFRNSAVVNNSKANISTVPNKVTDSTYEVLSWLSFQPLGGAYIVPRPPQNGLQFRTFFHPHTATFIDLLNRGGVQAVLDADTALDDRSGYKLYDDFGMTFHDTFRPTEFVDAQYAMENIDFSIEGTYSMYNWELFFQIPLFIATRLSKNGKYAEAMQWFHYIFDPTTNERPIPGSENVRYWKVYPFRTTITQQIEKILREINRTYNPDNENHAIQDWREYPFKPHKIAARRPSAYMIKVVLQYIENLVAWGDDLFRRDTIESINEATQLYVIANHILGKRPEFVPKRGEVKTETYNSLRDKLDDFSNAMVALENIFPNSSVAVSGEETTSSLLGLGTSFYFCIPSNDKMMQYWDTAADRLFKIRHCQNIDGTFRKLALFEPPIDPGLLVQAAAAGLSIRDILTASNLQRTNYRFQYLLQKANELCSEVKGLGAALLNAIEKKESEMISRIRAGQEANMLQMISEIKERQVLEARINMEGLAKNRASAKKRREHYLQLLGIDEVSIPDTEFLEETVNSSTNINETPIAETPVDVDVSLHEGGNGVKLIPKEKEDLDKMELANSFQISSASLEALSGILHLIPQFTVDGKPMGVGAGFGWGGQQIGAATSAAAKVLGIVSSQFGYEGNRASKMASYIRRDQDWVFQANTAAREIIQLDKQILGAQIRVQIAQKELANHHQQIENALETEAFLYSKFSNEELYQWQKEQLLMLHRQSYNLAYDLALKAENSYRFERGIDIESRIIQFNYWDNHVNGLMSGEKLQFGLRQLEKAYMDDNEKRDYEITKHISIAQLDPMALMELRTTGTTRFEIPEVLYDMDFPGQYFRRIKSVSISIPCITGPYTSVSAKLIHEASKYRKSTSLDGVDYIEQTEDGTEDPRFVRYTHVNPEAIATSSAQNDSGVFELNFRDERYVPFEGMGAISTWQLELPRAVKQFDYNTISDVIFHVKYTAREGGTDLKDAANDNMKTQLSAIKQFLSQPDPALSGLHIAINMKHDLPNEWHLLKTNGTIGLNLDKSRLPYMVQSFDPVVIESVTFLAKINNDPPAPFFIDFNDGHPPRNLEYVPGLALWTVVNFDIRLDALFTLSVLDADKGRLEELFVVVKYNF